MFEYTRRTFGLIGTAIGLTFVLGVAAAASVGTESDKGGDAEAAATATDAGTAEVAAPATTVAPAPAPPPAPSTTASTARRPATTARAAAPAGRAPTAAAAAAAPAAPASTVVARLNPSSAQVLAAMQTLKQQIPMLPLTESYGRDFGNKVCSAFDQGNGYAQVLAGVMAQAAKVPLVTISQGAADSAIRMAVQLFCPGHQAKLA